MTDLAQARLLIIGALRSETITFKQKMARKPISDRQVELGAEIVADLLALADKLESGSLRIVDASHGPLLCRDLGCRQDIPMSCALAREWHSTGIPPGKVAVGAEVLEALEARAADAEARLPDGMKHCTIQFKECRLGHGWLTAANWVQHGCPTCELRALEAVAKAAENLSAAAREYVEDTKVTVLNKCGSYYSMDCGGCEHEFGYYYAKAQDEMQAALAGLEAARRKAGA